MAHWNYRVLQYTDAEGVLCRAIHAVYYCGDGDSNPVSYSESPVQLESDVDVCDGRDHLTWVLDKAREALQKPVLKLEDFKAK